MLKKSALYFRAPSTGFRIWFRAWSLGPGASEVVYLVAEWIHFTLFGIGLGFRVLGFRSENLLVLVAEWIHLTLFGIGLGFRVLGFRSENLLVLVAEWIHLTLLGIIVPTLRLKVYTF